MLTCFQSRKRSLDLRNESQRPMVVFQRCRRHRYRTQRRTFRHFPGCPEEVCMILNCLRDQQAPINVSLLQFPHILTSVFRFCPSPRSLLQTLAVYMSIWRTSRGMHVTCSGALCAPNSTPPSRQFQSTMRPSRTKQYQIHHPWILFSKDLMNHSKMQSLHPPTSYKSWPLQEVVKQRPSPRGLRTSFNIIDTTHGTSFVSHSLSRVRVK